MGLGEIFDTIIEASGNSDTGLLGRAGNSNYDSFVRGAEERNRRRTQQAMLEDLRTSNNSSSNSSGGGIGSLILGAAVLGGLALLCGSGDDKNKTAQ